MGRVLLVTAFINFGFFNFSQAQSHLNQGVFPDTIYLSNLVSTYLAFPKEIDLINIGSPDYIFQVEKTMVYLKALHNNAKSTNMLIKCGEFILVVNLVFKLNPIKTLYDFRKSIGSSLNSKPNLETQPLKEMPKTNSENSFQEKRGKRTVMMAPSVDSLSVKDTSNSPFGISIERIKSSPDRFKTFGTAQNQITILLTNIFTDEKRMILKFKIINRSSLNYELDYVSFQFRRKTHYSQNTLLSPLYSSLTNSCGPKSQQTLVYILPIFGPADNGDFSVTFRELNGDRKETIEIPERAFKMAEIL